MKLLELYRADNDGYPICSGTGTFQPSVNTQSSGTVAACLAGELIPGYAASIPADPVNVAPSAYYYAVGYRRTGTNSYTTDTTGHYYILGARMDGGGANYSGWGVTLNYLLGSSG